MMSSVNDNIRVVLSKGLIDRLPQEACIPWKPDTRYQISLRKFLREDHDILKFTSTIDNQVYVEIKHLILI
jgi:hypothetical protein